LAILYVFTVTALLGFATFGLNPGLLAQMPESAEFYAISFLFFAQTQIWLAWAVLALFLTVHAGWRWGAAFAAVYLISLGSELAGTTIGLPFGEYAYTGALGAKWFGHVPFLIPLSWFFMAVPSYAIARSAFPARPLNRVLMGSLILLAWDLALDPAMSRATAYWVWAEPGSYYGMPWLNLFGWYVTGLALMAALTLLKTDEWMVRLPVGWLVAYYGANLLLPVGMSLAAGMWGAVAATVAALAATGALARVRGQRAAGLPERVVAA
jgi:uncharacterized membrane protein